jgi:hypothetical protein
MTALVTLMSMSKPSIVEVFTMHASETAATNDEMRMGCHLIVNSLWTVSHSAGATSQSAYSSTVLRRIK